MCLCNQSSKAWTQKHRTNKSTCINIHEALMDYLLPFCLMVPHKKTNMQAPMSLMDEYTIALSLIMLMGLNSSCSIET